MEEDFFLEDLSPMNRFSDEEFVNESPPQSSSQNYSRTSVKDVMKNQGLSLLADFLKTNPDVARGLLTPNGSKRMGLALAFDAIKQKDPGLRGTVIALSHALNEFDVWAENGSKDGGDGFRKLFEVKRQMNLPQKNPKQFTAPVQPTTHPRPRSSSKRKITFTVTDDVTIDLDPTGKKITLRWD